MNIERSMGPDKMHPRILMELDNRVAKLLSMLTQKAWQSGEVTNDWKKGDTALILKKGRKEGPGNYQPVSLTFCAREGHGTDPLEAVLRHIKN